ncbi:MAG: putative quinol monooxygenase [Candidatus Eisenbacteria bacterium]
MKRSTKVDPAKLTIVAQFQAKRGGEDQLEVLLGALVDPTRAERGCEVYDLHRSLETEGFFHFHEIWTTRAHWDAHMASSHIAEFRAASGDLIESVQILQLEQIR